MKPSPKEEAIEMDGPAIETSRHVWNRDVFNENTGALIIGKKGCRNLSAVELAYEQGKLGEKDSQDARRRRNAGLEYARIFDTTQPSGRDSTQALNLSRGSGTGIGIAAAQIDAFKQIGIINGMLGARDAIIIRAFCGDDMLPSAAVRLAGCDPETRASAKIREVLDDLAVALENLRGPRR